MKPKRAKSVALIILGGMFLGGVPALAQTQGSQPTQTPAPANKSKPTTPVPAPLTLDSSAPPVNAEEDGAMKVFRDAPVADVAAKDKLGEDFLQKYPQSRYRIEVYSWLVKGYLSQGQVDKMEAGGERALRTLPNAAPSAARLW